MVGLFRMIYYRITQREIILYCMDKLIDDFLVFAAKGKFFGEKLGSESIELSWLSKGSFLYVYCIFWVFNITNDKNIIYKYKHFTNYRTNRLQSVNRRRLSDRRLTLEH